MENKTKIYLKLLTMSFPALINNNLLNTQLLNTQLRKRLFDHVPFTLVNNCLLNTQLKVRPSCAILGKLGKLFRFQLLL